MLSLLFMTHHDQQQKLRLIRPGNIFQFLLSSFDERVWIVTSVCCYDSSGSCSPVALTWDVLVHSLVVLSDYLSNCCFSMSSDQSPHSPPTSDINKAFFTCRTAAGYSLFSSSFSVNTSDGWKIAADQQFLNYSDQNSVAPINTRCSKPLSEELYFDWLVIFHVSTSCLCLVYTSIFSTWLIYSFVRLGCSGLFQC